MTEPDPKDLGYQFGCALLADPSTDTAALDDHPLSNGYRLCMAGLLFQCGRQTGLIELGDEAAGDFLEGFVNALADREPDLDASPRRRRDDPN